MDHRSVRNTDPDTSHEAYESINVTEIEQRVFEFIEAAGSWGTTADELDKVMPLPLNTITPRAAQLEAKGRIVRPGNKRKARSGRNQLVMYATKFAPKV